MKTFAAVMTLLSFNPGTSLVHLRELYYAAATDAQREAAFESYLRSDPPVKRNTLTAYYGMFYLIRANHSWNPYRKIADFNRGRNTLEGCIRKDPADPELRFLRYCVQSNAPGFLNYSGSLKEDRAFLVHAIPGIEDADLSERITAYLYGEPKQGKR